MRRLIGCAAFAALSLGLVIAADPPKPAEPKDTFDTVIKDMIAQLGTLGDQLAKVTDEKSAKESKKKVEETVGKLMTLKDRADKLGKLNPDEEKRLETRYKTDLDSAVSKMNSEAVRLAGVPYGKEILDAIKTKSKPGAAPKGPPAPPAPPVAK